MQTAEQTGDFAGMEQGMAECFPGNPAWEGCSPILSVNALVPIVLAPGAHVCLQIIFLLKAKEQKPKKLLNWKITSSKLICRKSNALSFIIPKPMKTTQGTAPCALYREKELFCLKKTQAASLRDWGKKCSSLMISLVSVSFI